MYTCRCMSSLRRAMFAKAPMVQVYEDRSPSASHIAILPIVWHQVSCNQDYLKLMHACINLGWNRPDWSSPKN